MDPSLASLATVGATTESIPASTDRDRRAVADLDAQFQAAVKRNDAETIDRILHEDMVLVLGDGRTCTRAEIVSPLDCGSRARARTRPLTDACGSATRMCAPAMGGNMFSARYR
jgi:hypothetical protein